MSQRPPLGPTSIRTPFARSKHSDQPSLYSTLPLSRRPSRPAAEPTLSNSTKVAFSPRIAAASLASPWFLRTARCANTYSPCEFICVGYQSLGRHVLSQSFNHAAGPWAVGLFAFRSLIFAFLNASACAGSQVSGCQLSSLFFKQLRFPQRMQLYLVPRAVRC